MMAPATVLVKMLRVSRFINPPYERAFARLRRGPLHLAFLAGSVGFIDVSVTYKSRHALLPLVSSRRSANLSRWVRAVRDFPAVLAKRRL
jgi:hypothetical protein